MTKKDARVTRLQGEEPKEPTGPQGSWPVCPLEGRLVLTQLQGLG